MKSIMSLHNIAFAYDNKAVLNNISLEIPDNCITAIVGQNGSGKSTLLKLMARLQLPDSGKIIFKDKHLSSLSNPELAKNISYLGQFNSLAFDLTVSEILNLGLRAFNIQNIDDAACYIHELSKDYGLNKFLNSNISSLSGGQRQLVFLAYTMLREPSLLLLDEPINHLDIKNQYLFFERLCNLIDKKNISIVVVMHDLNHALKFSDYISVNYNSSIRFGKTADVLRPCLVNQTMSINSELIDASDSKIFNYIVNQSKLLNDN